LLIFLFKEKISKRNLPVLLKIPGAPYEEEHLRVVKEEYEFGFVHLFLKEEEQVSSFD
jgi:hypothetical protein